MERIRGFIALFVVILAIVSLATARSAASEAAGALLNVADDDDAGLAPIEARSLRRLRAAPMRRELLDAMPWDTVADQPGSVATTDVVKDPRDPACYDCGRLGGKKGGSSSSGSKLVEPESAAEDEAEGEEAAAVVVVVEDEPGGQPFLFVAPSASAAAAAAASPGPAPVAVPALSSPRRREPLAEGGEIETTPLPSSP